MKTLSIDIETYSGADLAKAGVYRYAEDADFEVMLFAYSADGGPVRVVDLMRGERIPDAVLDALADPKVEKWAFNASFERVCLSEHLRRCGCGLGSAPDGGPGLYLDAASWRCSMVWCATLGLPMSLEGAGAVLGIGKRKLSEGKELVRYFCQPCAPTKANGHRTRNLPSHAPERWESFKAYNARDVEAEMEIQQRLARFPVPQTTWDEYRIDQQVNDRGVALDLALVDAAIAMDERSRSELMEEMTRLTGLENPNSVAQLKGWLARRGVAAESLDKKAVAAIIEGADGDVADVLRLRQQASKSSVRKYQRMREASCADGRARGMIQFYGASRTGRWAGRLVQLQNLPQNHLPDLGEARALVRTGDYEAVAMLYGDVPDTLSQLVRTAFVAGDGTRLVVCDYSAIEARVIAWMAREGWRQRVFEEGGDIYCASASQMFKVPVEKHGRNAHLRQKGKIAELALGYGGSVGALKAMGAVEMGIPEDELASLVEAWRQANPSIVRLWRNVDASAKGAVASRRRTEAHGIGFSYEAGMLLVRLPSGRRLAYAKPTIGENRFGGESITYMGTGANRKWERLETYGAKLVENIVQATSRDILAHAMGSLSGERIVMHVHDELIVEAAPGTTVADVSALMERTPPWAEGLKLRAEGYECDFYRKD